MRVDPAAAIPGGEVVIHCERFDTKQRAECAVWFDNARGQIVGASPTRVLAIVPDDEKTDGEVELTLQSNEWQRSEPSRVVLGRKLADELHLVANPAVDPEDGSLILTRSGSRGQRLPTTMFRLEAGINSDVVPLTGDVINPTGIAFDRDGQMFVTSRMDGVVYRMSSASEPTAFARDLGVATGIAFDRRGDLYVGDRTGTIHRVNSIGEAREWAQIEPSVSAYHLAFGADDALYVTGPTVSSYEAVWRIDESGDAEVFYRGLGRPQGLAFDTEGNLYVAASWHGRRGIVRIAPDGTDAEMAVAGMNVVGLCFDAADNMVVATNDAVYRLPLGIRGALLQRG